MTTSSGYGEALNWAEQLHRHQSRHGKAVPFLSHVISVSALVWEDGGNEDQAIAGAWKPSRSRLSTAKELLWPRLCRRRFSSSNDASLLGSPV